MIVVSRLRQMLLLLTACLAMVSSAVGRFLPCCDDDVEHVAAQVEQQETGTLEDAADQDHGDGCGLSCLACCACCQSVPAVVPSPSALTFVYAKPLDFAHVVPPPNSPDPEERLQVPKAA